MSQYEGFANNRDRLWKEWERLMFHQDGSGVEICPLNTQPQALSKWFTPPSKLLFLGCGPGEEVRYAKAQGFEASGVTLSGETLDSIKTLGLDIIQCDAHFLPETWEGTFDGVLSFHVFEHSPAPLIFMRECFRVLKNGGRVYHEVPEEENGMLDDRLVHTFVPTAIQAKGWLLKSGFSSIEMGQAPYTSTAQGLYMTGIKP